MGFMDERSRADAPAWREQLLLTVTHWSALFGGVIAVGVIIRSVFFNFADAGDPSFIAMFLGYGAIVATRLLPGLSYRVRELTMSAAGFVVAGGVRGARRFAVERVLVL